MASTYLFVPKVLQNWRMILRWFGQAPSLKSHYLSVIIHSPSNLYSNVDNGQNLNTFIKLSTNMIFLNLRCDIFSYLIIKIQNGSYDVICIIKALFWSVLKLRKVDTCTIWESFLWFFCNWSSHICVWKWYTLETL